MNHSIRHAWTLLATLAGLSLGAQDARCDADRGWSLAGGLGYNHIDSEKGFDLHQDPGIRVVATGGFRFNRRFALELDSGYIRNTFTRSGQASSKKPLSQVPVVVGGVFSFPNQSRLEPFLGAGLGAMFVQMGDAAGGDLCLGFKGGARYGINEQMALGADYTFFMLGVASAFIGEAVGDDTFNLTLRWAY